MEFYTAYNPTKMNEVPGICTKYKGRELELCQKLDLKYKTGTSLQQKFNSLSTLCSTNRHMSRSCSP